MLMVFTDLDGTLLDHHDYSFTAAEPALARLRAADVPLILVSSKTFAELVGYQKVLGIHQPFIAENGGAICIPRGYFPTDDDLPALEPMDGYAVELLSPPYDELVARLAGVRREQGFRFRGFADMDDAEVAELTGLSLEAAGRARTRLCSEPILWQDSDEARTLFEDWLATQGLRALQGGRFLHVLGQTDKGAAMSRLINRYLQAGFEPPYSIALGDSANDLDMLRCADQAVVVSNPHGHAIERDTLPQAFFTEGVGPVGWGQAVDSLLNHYEDRQHG